MVHLAVAAVINALWDLWAKIEGKVSMKLILNLSGAVSSPHNADFWF